MTRKKKRKYRHNRPRFNFLQIEISDEIKKDVVAISFFVLALISFLSFANLAGGLGERLSEIVQILFGWGFILFPFVLILWGWKMIKSENIFESRTSLLGTVVMFFSVLSLLHIFFDINIMFEVAKSAIGGGFVGAIFAWILVSLIGKWGGLIIIIAMIVVSILLIFDISFIELLSKFRFSQKIDKFDFENKKVDNNEGKNDDNKYIENDDIKVNIAGKRQQKKGIISSLFEKNKKDNKKVEFSIRSINSEETEDVKEIEETEETEEMVFEKKSSSDNVVSLKKQQKDNWILPPLNLLDGADKEPTSGDIRANSNIIKRTLADFGIQVEMGEVNVGPTVTQYTLKPAVGIKLSRITALQNDLSLALAARSIRMEAPIPGKSWVGLELPNQSVAMVRLKNMLNSPEFNNRESNLNIILGRDVAGDAILASLENMPHLMIAGSTGSGKTVCVNTLITGLLYQNTPDVLKLIMVDPKRVELTPYNDIPHLLTPVIVDPDKAVNSLKWSIKEMEERYEILSQLGCRNIESYNRAVRTKYKQRDVLPYIVIIVDELADLMTTHGREVETAIVRLAQKSRAIGIHLILSTQRPSVEVITGLIKANITTRIAFQVASQIDSRTILDMSGAEKLLGSGDMLYLSGDSNKPRRIQGVFISEEEVKKVSQFLGNQKDQEIQYDQEIIESKKSSIDFSSEDNIVDDDLYDEAVEVVNNAQKASASLLQRRLRIGYARAARLLDLMEEQGIIGPANGAKPREVYETVEPKDDEEIEE